MTLENALKAFRRMGYKYGEAANGLIISANAQQMSIVVAQSYSVMSGGSALAIMHRAERTIEMAGAGSLYFRTVDDVFNDLLKGHNFPFIALTQLALVEGGVSMEHQLIAQHRSPTIPEVDRKWLTLENV